MKTKRIATAALVVLLSLSLVACSTSQVVTDIQIAADLVAVGAPVVAAFGGPGAAVAVAYMTTAAHGLNCVLTAAQAAGATTATISAAFATCFASAIVPVLPAGTPPQVAAIVMAVSAAINVLITRYGPKATVAATPTSLKFKLTYQDRRDITKMHKRLDTAIGELAAHGR